MRDAFCILPWNHLEIKPTGAVKICCVAAREIQIHERSATVGRDPLADIWNSQYMKNVRAAMLEGQALPDCAHCYRQETLQPKSLRYWSNREWMLQYGVSKEGLVDLARELGVVVQRSPAYFQLSLGNECNLKCRMCCSDYSSQIQQDPVQNQWAPNWDPESHKVSSSWHKNDDFFVNELF